MSTNPEQPHNPEQVSSQEVAFKVEIEKVLEQKGLQLATQIKDLRERAKTEADFKLIQEKIEELTSLFEPKSPEVNKNEKSYEKAREIMGKDFFGREEIENVFGVFSFDFNDVLIPTIPYSSERLEQAKENGEMLVFRTSKIGAADVTMENIIRIVQPVMSADEGKLLSNIDWYENEYLFKNQPVREGWALVSKEIIKNSTDKNYIEQTQVLRDHLISLNSLTIEEYREVIDSKLFEIRTLMDTDWQAAAKQLSELKINQNHRRTVVEALYDFIIRFKNTDDKERMLEHTYDWTNTCITDGYLTNFGMTDLRGAFMSGDKPANVSSILGVVSVR